MNRGFLSYNLELTTFMCCKRYQRCVVPTHAVYAAAGWCGRTAEIKARIAGAAAACGRAEEKLRKRHSAAGNIAAGEVGVPLGERGGRRGAARDDAILKAGSEAGDLR